MATDLTCPLPSSISSALLVQLHGAPHAKEDDKRLLDLLAQHSSTSGKAPRLAVLIHRPDELPLTQPHFRSVFDLYASSSPRVPMKLVFMGDMHINDACYQIGDVTVCVALSLVCICGPDGSLRALSLSLSLSERQWAYCSRVVPLSFTQCSA